MSTEGYTISDLSAMRELAHRNRWPLLMGPVAERIEHESVSNLQYLRDMGYDDDVAVRAALTWDCSRWPGNGYQEVFADPAPTPTEREWLLSCGYTEEVVDAHLAKAAEEQRRSAAIAAERAARERTWRFSARRAWKEATGRIRLAWAVLRGRHDCEEDW